MPQNSTCTTLEVSSATSVLYGLNSKRFWSIVAKMNPLACQNLTMRKADIPQLEICPCRANNFK